MSVLYRNPHRSQYGAGASSRTRAQGCTWTSLANGANAATGGRVNKSPDQILALVRQSEETNPSTPGWSLGDAKKAMDRLGVPFAVRSGEGWTSVLNYLNSRHYVILQGDSDVFSSATCSGAFDGDHCVGLHPHYDSLIRQRLNDPICLGARYAGRSILRAYATKFRSDIAFGVFLTPVPLVTEPHVVLSAPTPAERNTMITYANTVQSDVTMDLAKDQPLFRHPGGPRVTKMSKQAEVDFFGAAGAGWVAVRVSTGAPYKDKVARPTILYVPRSAGPINR